MSILCIYHGNCADGFGAAWVVRDALGADNVEFYPGVHQDPPPDVTDRDVLMVDFAYKRPVLEQMAARARSIVIIDHHKTAAEDLEPFVVEVDTGKDQALKNIPGMLRDLAELKTPPIVAVFDMKRSGAGLTWDVFHPEQARPPLIDHIEDRDLWRFALKHTRPIQAAVFSYPYHFDTWSGLFYTDLEQLRIEGEAIERKHFKDIHELLAVVTRFFRIGGYSVPIANLPYTLTSDAGHALAQDHPFAGCFWFTPEGWVFSLRSHEDGVDVAEIAKQYGGGGHKHAAGFRVPLNRLGEFCEAVKPD